MKHHSVVLNLLLGAFLLISALPMNGCSSVPTEEQTVQESESAGTADLSTVQEENETAEETPAEEIEEITEETPIVEIAEEETPAEEIIAEEILEEEIIPEEMPVEEIIVEEIIEEMEEAAPEAAEETALRLPADSTIDLPADFVYPKTDGSTSAINLDNAVRSAIFGGAHTVSHTKTYTAFNNLLRGQCELIFITPLSDVQLQTMENIGFRHEAEPVAGEGFVFVVNKDNPVDTLTVEQIKGIYSGEITNWSEVGGNDAEIIAYQRNADSGSQNYMIAFMGDTPLMKPVTDQVPGSMSGILDVIANYDNGINAIGYSVYAYSDGMYENISEIKYIKVNGVEPSLETLADGSYPLLGYNYAVFSADEPEDSNVRALVKWMQSDEGQQVIADAGYVPYRHVEGLTLPEPSVKTLYTASATSGIAQPETMADYYYQCSKVPESFTAEGLDEKIQSFIDEATAELSAIDEESKKAFYSTRGAYELLSAQGDTVNTRCTLVNGYLSVTVGLRYDLGHQDSPLYYYDARSAVFDIYTGKRLELSDLFFDGVDFVPLLNRCLADGAETPYSSFGITHDMIAEFTGLHEGEFEFTADSIIFKPGTCFADGAELSIASLSEYMVTSIPRDMAGYADAETPVYMKIRERFDYGIGNAEVKNGITIWYLDKDKAPVSDEVCDKVNAFIDNTYETYFTPEKLTEALDNMGVAADGAEVGPFPDFEITLTGERYIAFRGANQAFAKNSSEPCEFVVIDGHYSEYYFRYYFNAQTGEELRIGDLFRDGWEETAELYIADENFNIWETASCTEYTGELDLSTCRIMSIENYVTAPYNKGDLSDLDLPVAVYADDGSGSIIAVCVQREFIY